MYDGPISPDPVEVDEGKFWPLDEIKNAIGKEVLTPNFEMEFENVMFTLRKRDFSQENSRLLSERESLGSLILKILNKKESCSRNVTAFLLEFIFLTLYP